MLLSYLIGLSLYHIYFIVFSKVSFAVVIEVNIYLLFSFLNFFYKTFYYCNFVIFRFTVLSFQR